MGPTSPAGCDDARPVPSESQGAPGSRERLDAKREIVVHQVTDGPAKGWLHTHGLGAHGKPELEIRGVPLFLGAAAAFLNELADHLLNARPARRRHRCAGSGVLSPNG